jgi:hypothetical membrane protein
MAIPAVSALRDAGLRPSTRLLAIGGVIGPVAFVSTWAIAGRVTNHYSPIDDAISELAKTGASTQPAMTAAFIAFGIGVIAFAAALREAGAGRAWVSAVATAVCTLGVASFPLGGPARDVVHGVFASLGYLTLAGVPLLSARPLARAGRTGWARASIGVAAVSGVCLLASAAGPAHGFFQRAGLTTGDAWIVAVALQLIGGRNLFAPRPARA